MTPLADLNIKFSEGLKYIKAYSEDTIGHRSAIAFFDMERGIWLEAKSWARPSRRLSINPEALTEALDAAVKLGRLGGQP